MRCPAPIAALLFCLPQLAAAEGVLDGQGVELRAVVISFEGEPQLSSRAIQLEAGPGVELPSMHRARAAFGDDISNVIEISVDLQRDAIEISYAASGWATYTDGAFVGYEFLLPGLPQTVIDSAVLDQNERLGGMVDSDLISVPGGLRLDVGGRAVDLHSRIRIEFPQIALGA